MTRNNRISRNALALVAGALLLPLAAQAQVLEHQWANNARTLDIIFLPNPVGNYPSPDIAVVNVRENNPEPDPTPGNGFTYGDAVRRAVEAWNHAQTGWTFRVLAAGQNPTNPHIEVYLTEDLAKQQGHIDADADKLAWWQTATFDENGKLLSGKIFFNIIHTFGIGRNQLGDDDDDLHFDPINIAIHELGHAIRLGHPSADGCVRRNNANNIEVMEPFTNAGVHLFNRNQNFNRYPHQKDIDRAKKTARKMVDGKMDIGGYVGNPSQIMLTIEVRPPGNPFHILESHTTPLNHDGSFEVVVQVPPGTYDLATYGSNFLQRVRYGVTIDLDGASGQNYTCTFGDIAWDNEINIGDYAYLVWSFGSSPGEPTWFANADLNGDEEINVGDFAILASNFGEWGDL